jgi:hypothetical protein
MKSSKSNAEILLDTFFLGILLPPSESGLSLVEKLKAVKLILTAPL